MQECKYSKVLEKEGYKPSQWCMERSVCPRFTAPDENGKIILDICNYIE